MQIRYNLGKILKRFFYLKICYNRTHSYIGIPLELIKDFGLASIYLKLYFPDLNLIWIMLSFIILVILAIIFGHFDIKCKFAHLEQSVVNQLNPELMKIYEKNK